MKGPPVRVRASAFAHLQGLSPVQATSTARFGYETGTSADRFTVSEGVLRRGRVIGICRHFMTVGRSPRHVARLPERARPLTRVPGLPCLCQSFARDGQPHPRRSPSARIRSRTTRRAHRSPTSSRAEVVLHSRIGDKADLCRVEASMRERSSCRHLDQQRQYTCDYGGQEHEDARPEREPRRPAIVNGAREREERRRRRNEE
jgi:hypothetical protein